MSGSRRERSVRLLPGLGVGCGYFCIRRRRRRRRFGALGKIDEIEENPGGEEEDGAQVVEDVAVYETVHNAEHEAALPRLQRSGN